MPNGLYEKDALDYIWNYFQLHANQRMSVFNFYISFSSLITIPLMLTFGNERNFHLLGIILGFLLFLLSLVFWRLDRRTKILIETSENALKQLENKFYSENDEMAGNVRIFQLEEASTRDMKKWKHFPNNLLVTYASCFRLVFFVFGLIGILFLIYHLSNVVSNPQLLLNPTSIDIKNDTLKI